MLCCVIPLESSHREGEADLAGLFDLVVFVAAPPDECLRRRLARDTAERGRTAEGVQRQWDKQVLPSRTPSLNS